MQTQLKSLLTAKEDGENNECSLPDRDADLTDAVRNQNEDEGQQVDDPFHLDAFSQGLVQIFFLFLFHDALLVKKCVTFFGIIVKQSPMTKNSI